MGALATIIIAASIMTVYGMAEIVGDASVGKDRRRLPPAYFAAGVMEFWLSDARDYVQQGKVFRYKADATLMNEWDAGVIPGGFFFY